MSERIEAGDEVEILTGPRAGLLMDVYSMTEEDGCYLSGLVNECRTNLRLIRKSPAKLTPSVPPPARDWKPDDTSTCTATKSPMTTEEIERSFDKMNAIQKEHTRCMAQSLLGMRVVHDVNLQPNEVVFVVGSKVWEELNTLSSIHPMTGREP